MKTILLLLIFCKLECQLCLAQENKINFSNPALIAGSSILNVFQQFYMRQQFDEMIKLTSEISLKQFGNDAVRKYYQRMNFAYPIKLKTITKDHETYLLRYTTTISASKISILLKIHIENDSSKLVLPNISTRFFLVE